MNRFVTVSTEPNPLIELLTGVALFKARARMDFAWYQMMKGQPDLSLAELTLGRLVAAVGHGWSEDLIVREDELVIGLR